MSDVLVFGDVPHSVVKALEACGRDIQRLSSGHRGLKAGLGSAQGVGAGDRFLVAAVPEDEKALSGIQDLLPSFADAGYRVALTSPAGLTLGAMQLFLAARMDRPLLLNAGECVDQSAVAQFLEQTEAEDLGGAQTVELGWNCTVTNDVAEYRRQRALVVVMDDAMRAFFADLCAAVLEMARPGLPRPIPWDPDGPLTDRTDVGPDFSLIDTLRLHSEPSVHRLLHPTDENGKEITEWDPPTLLLLGETGTGKTMIAKLVASLVENEVHATEFPFVSVNCPGLAGESYSHLLHGTAAQQFSGIENPVVGMFAKGAYGAVFLDEVGDLPDDAQASLLVFLQDGRVTPTAIPPFLGFSRIIAATNRDLDGLIQSGSYREDLVARFKHKLTIPPLRNRSVDERRRLVHYAAIDPVVNSDRTVKRITAEALDNLAQRPYANFNYRELEAVVHGALANARRRNSDCIVLADLPGESDQIVIAERDRRVIDVLAPPDASQKVQVRKPGDLRRMADGSNLPIFRTSDGAEYVLSAGCLFWCPQSAADGPMAAEDPAFDGKVLRDWLPDAWGRVLIADNAGPAVGDPTHDYSALHPIASNLAGDTLVAAATDGAARAFPRHTFGSDWTAQLEAGSECVCLGASNDLVTRRNGRLELYQFDHRRGGFPVDADDSRWPQVDGNEVVRAFLVPGSSGLEELAVLNRNGAVNDVARRLLNPVGSFDKVRDLDLIQQKDGLWIAVVLDEVAVTRAIKVFRVGDNPVGPFGFGHPYLNDSRDVQQVLWARGTSVDPLLVVAFGKGRPSNLDRRISSERGTWKDQP